MAEAVAVVDDPATWSSALTAAVSPVADRLSGTTRHPLDLAFTQLEDYSITDALAGAEVRLYHSTRLLPHEVEQVLAVGLRTLDADLIYDRLDQAVATGHLTRAEADELAATHTPLDRPSEVRAGQVCATATTWSLTHDPGAVEPLMTRWGGEAIYWAHGHDHLGARLGSIGTPAVVVFHAPAHRLGDDWFPPLPRLLVGAQLALDGVDADVFLRAPVSAGAIEDVWLPGDPKFDRFALLPRS
ncbi:hypothetical protein [Cellulomonas hominis]